MVELQILSKILDTGDYSILRDNFITHEYFKGTGYEKEFEFIDNHITMYGNVPDKATFLAEFPDIELVEVSESNEYLVDTIREEYQFRKLAPVVEKIAELGNTDANKATEYMSQAVKDLRPNYKVGGVDLIQDITRAEHYKSRVANQNDWYFSTGFPELDNIIHGIQRFEELVVLFARLGQGKSWVLAKMVTHIWKLGFNVCYISPEMGPDSVGYRVDTLLNGYSNRDLMWGLSGVDVASYEKDLAERKANHKNKFIVSTPGDFNNKITVSKLRNFVKQHNLDILAIDGIKYLSDERYRRGDNTTTTLTNISEDLMALSVELQIPIIVVVQANREGAGDDVPNIENIRDSDGIAQNATKVIALRQDEGNLEMLVEKNRYGTTGNKLKYIWNINIGEFIYTEGAETISKEEQAERKAKKKATGKDVF